MAYYCALMADIVASRGYDGEERDRIQLNLDLIVKTLNVIYQKSLVKPVMFSGGDEVQGLFRQPAEAYEYARLLQLLLLPARVRIGLGIGEWSLRVDDDQSTKQDGPAYHLARETVEQMKAQRTVQSLCFGDRDTSRQETFNGIFGMIDALERKQSKGQRRIFVTGRVLFGTMFYQGVEASVRKSEYFRQTLHILALAEQIGHPHLGAIRDFPMEQERFRIRKWMAQETGTSEQNISQQMKMGACDEIVQGERALESLLKEAFGRKINY